MKTKGFIFGGILLVLILGIIFIPAGKAIHMINSDQLQDMINSDDVFVINTHTPYVGEINGTDLVAEDWQHMENYVNSLPKDKNAKIVVYCRSGHMSGVAAEELKKMGYKNIYDLEGGMNSWTSSGKKIIQN